MTQSSLPAEIDHKSRAHALLSASSSERWINCPPSVRLSEGLPDDVSPFAAEGTKAHEIAESCIRAFLRGEPEPAFTGEEYLIWLEVYPYVDRVIELFNTCKAEDPSAQLFVEVRVDYSRWAPGGFGTSDCVILAGGAIYVIDLKFGKGVVVDAKDNPQARCYALGAFEAYSCLYDIDRVVMIIDQPRLSHRTMEEISVEDLMTWADNVLVPAAELAYKGEGPLTAGPWCRFCKVGARCKARAVRNLSVQDGYPELPDPSLLTDEQIAAVLDRADDLEIWVKKIKAYAIDEITENGVSLPGWKVVDGRTNRIITDETAVMRKLRSMGYKPSQYYTRKMLTITQMQSLLGGRKAMEDAIGDYIGRTEPKPQLVRASDRRPAINAESNDDFKDL